MNYFLTIAASDTSGGAGVQQDVKVASDFGFWALSAITGITVQNFKTVFKIKACSSDILKFQIEQCFSSFPVKAVKIGAICNKENAIVIADCLKEFSAENVILDPVLSSSGGTSFLETTAINYLQETLFPLTALVTPNKPEFELLVNQNIGTIEEAIEIATKKCKEWNTSILLKGGHYDDTKIKEALVTKTDLFCFERERKEFSYSHGTGCTLSSALACCLGNNYSLIDSYTLASKYLVDLYSGLQIKLRV